VNYPDFLTQNFMGNEVVDYVYAALVFVGTLWGFLLVRKLIIDRLRSLAKLTATDLDDVAVELLELIKAPECYLLALYTATRPLHMNARFDHAIHVVVVIVIAYRVTTMLQAAAAYGIRQTVLADGTDEAHQATAQTVTLAAHGVIWVGAVLFTLSNLGFNVSSMIAGLGISGIAVALAAQAVLGDLFAAVAIYLDKPFVVGDAIKVGDMAGTVQHIGVKTTRVRALTGEMLVFPNAMLTGQRIQNFRDVQVRRHQASLLLSLGTSTEQLKKLPGLLQDIIEKTPTTRFERAHLLAVRENGFELEFVFHVLSTDYNVYMDRVQAVLTGFVERLRAEGVSLASPARSVVIEGGKLPA
jgi:small-conductance mechanosensitive channel